MVGFLDEHDKAHSVNRLMCAPVSGGYRVACDTGPESHEIVKDAETYCGARHAIVEIRYEGGEIKRMECCEVTTQLVNN